MVNNVLHYCLWAVTTVLYAPLFYQLYHRRWEVVDYTHAYFILPISLWLAWRKRQELTSSIKPNVSRLTSWAFLSLFILGLLLFIFGWRQEYGFISTLSLIPVLFGVTGYVYGPKTVKILTFPILYLLVLVPPPLGILDSITLPMRYGVSVVSETILKALHYPIIRDGLLLSINNHEIYMGAPCSGFRSLITMISLGLVYVYLGSANLFKKAILIAAIVPLALLGNLLRVVSVCIVTYYYGDVIGQKYHDISGFVIFIFVILGLVGLDKLCKIKE